VTRPVSRRRGLGLAELLVSLSITASLLAAVGAAFSATTSTIEMNDQFFRASQAARVSMNQIMAEVRKCTSGVVDVDSLELSPPTGPRRRYYYDAANKRVTLTFPEVDATTYTLARNVNAAEFYTDGETIAMRVRIEIGKNKVTLNGSAMPRRTMSFD
jgi:hypothetical protein